MPFLCHFLNIYNPLPIYAGKLRINFFILFFSAYVKNQSGFEKTQWNKKTINYDNQAKNNDSGVYVCKYFSFLLKEKSNNLKFDESIDNYAEKLMRLCFNIH